MKSLATALFVALSLAATSANAQATGNEPPPPPEPMVQPTIQSTMSDDDFIMKATEGAMKELAAGKLGVQKANHADVKAFAQRMVTDHIKASEELMTLAKTRNVTLKKIDEPTAAGTEPPAMPNALNTLSGEAFDRAYMDQMVKEHQAKVFLFEAQARDGKDAAVTAWAAHKLPTLETHLKAAQTLQARLGR